jgi:hypothetical protein
VRICIDQETDHHERRLRDLPWIQMVRAMPDPQPGHTGPKGLGNLVNRSVLVSVFKDAKLVP